MIKWFSLSILVFSVACSTAQEDKQKSKTIIHQIEVSAFKTLAAKKDAVIIDVRTPKEIQKGKIADALEIDYRSKDFEKKIQQLDKNKSYLVYCAGGVRSNRACKKMQEMGFEKLYNLKLGYKDWQKAHDIEVESDGKILRNR